MRFLRLVGGPPRRGDPSSMGLVGGPIRRSSGILGSVAYALLLPPRPTPFTSVGYVQVDAVAGQGGAAAASLPWEADDDPGAFSGFYLLDNICYIYI